MSRPTEADLEWLRQNHRSLLVFRSADVTNIVGVLSFSRINSDGTRIDDSYSIAIKLPDSKDRLPEVYEKGGRLQDVMEKKGLKKLADLHCYPSGKLCLAAPQELTLDFLRAPSLERLVEGYLVPFFYSQSHYEQHGRWPWPHWRHGAKGLLDWYHDNTGVDGAARETVKALRELKTDKAAVRILARGARPDSFNRRAKCLCGKNKSFMQCHPRYIALAFYIRSGTAYTGHSKRKRKKRPKPRRK